MRWGRRWRRVLGKWWRWDRLWPLARWRKNRGRAGSGAQILASNPTQESVDRSQRLLKSHFVIRGRAVGSGHRFFVQAQIYAQLSAVMYEMIHKHLAVGQKSGSLENCFALKTEFPVFRPCA